METVTISRTEYESLQETNARLQQQVDYLLLQMRVSRQRQFGPSSEKSEYDQLSLFNEAELMSNKQAPEPELVEVEKHYRKRKRLVNDKLPDDLPVEVVEHDLPAGEKVCSECGGTLHQIGQETRRELKLIPAKAVIVEHVRHVYGCHKCEQDEFGVPVQKAPVAEPVIKGSFASPESVSQIMTQKFVMGVPLYRQEQEWARQGIPLSRQTMSNWLLRATEDWLQPVYDTLHKHLCSRSVLHADETTLQVLHEPGKTAQSKSYMWLYRTSGDTEHPIVLYDYQPDRRAKRPIDFLQGFQGYLMDMKGTMVYRGAS